MANFCPKCGTPSNGATFCGKCGAALHAPAAPQNYVPNTPAATPNYVPNAPTYVPPGAAAPAKGMSTLAKVAIAALIVIVVFGAAGVVGAMYVVHRVKQKVAEVSGGLVEDSSSSSSSRSSSSKGSMGDVCRYLSKEEVSRAVGVTITKVKSEENSCSYMIAGDAADMTAKHLAAIGGSHGADSQQQNMVQGFASTIFKSQPGESHDQMSDGQGNVPVLVIGIDDENGITQMRLEKSTLGKFPGSEILTGIGDEAFDAGNAMMTVRKGNRLIKIMYTTCPCTNEAIKPLARKLANAL